MGCPASTRPRITDAPIRGTFIPARWTTPAASQECYEPAHWDAVRNGLSDLYPHVAREHPTGRWGRYHNALAFLSSYPIKGQSFQMFSRTPFLEAVLGTKGALTALIELPPPISATVAFVNVHLTAGGLLDPADDTVDADRAQQILETDAISAAAMARAPHNHNRSQHADAPTSPWANATAVARVILGDINAGPAASRGNWMLARELGYRDAWLEYAESAGAAVATEDDENSDNYFLEDGEAAPARAPTSGEHLREGETWDPYNPLNARGPHRHAPPDRIDHVFLKSGTALDAWRVEKAETMFQAPIVPTSEGNVTISDHYGLVVSLRWQAPA